MEDRRNRTDQVLSEEEFLRTYDPSDYERPSLTSDVLVFTTDRTVLRILLVRRTEPPFSGKWALPGTFIRMEETAEEAAARALRDKTGAEGIFLEQLYTFSALDRDPRMRIITVAYIAMVPAGRLLFKQGEEKGQAMLFDIVREGEDICLRSGGVVLDMKEIAFDHAHMIRTAMDLLAGKIDYTDIAFEFLPDKSRFTLTQLRQIYEAVTGRTYDIGNFRRFIRNRYIVPGRIENNHEEWQEGTPRSVGRPGASYRYTGVNRNKKGVRTRQT